MEHFFNGQWWKGTLVIRGSAMRGWGILTILVNWYSDKNRPLLPGEDVNPQEPPSVLRGNFSHMLCIFQHAVRPGQQGEI